MTNPTSVDLDELDADARWISDWFDDGDKVSMPPLGEFERVANAAHSLIAELREARKTIAGTCRQVVSLSKDKRDLEEALKPFVEGSEYLHDVRYDQKIVKISIGIEHARRAARLLNPAKETP